MTSSGRSPAPWAALLLGVLAGAAPAAERSVSPEEGAVCIAPVPAAGYTVRLDEGPELRASTAASVGVGGLGADQGHVVVVRRDGRVEDLLRFDFARFENRFLCLAFDLHAGAWSLKEVKRSAGACLCKGGAAPAPGLRGWPTVSGLYERGVDVYAQGRLGEAVKSFEDVLDIEPQNASAKRALSRVRKEIADDSPGPPARR